MDICAGRSKGYTQHITKKGLARLLYTPEFRGMVGLCAARQGKIVR